MSTNNSSERVLIFALMGQEAKAVKEMLTEHGFEVKICLDPREASPQASANAGAIVMTDEALATPQTSELLETLKAQPAWSELPLVILTSNRAPSPQRMIESAVTAAGSATVLERPVSMSTLVRTMEVALRSRRRQYQVRDLLEEQQRREQQLREAKAQLQDHASRLETMVAERTQDLRSINEQLEAFVYSIAHDLRAPLRTMSGFSRVLLEDYAAGLQDEAQEHLKRIQASAEFMDKLLLDLIAYGRAARAPMELTTVEIHQAWASAVFQCSAQIAQTKAQIETIEPLPRVLAHEATIGQCLANLLSNALKFVEPGIAPHVKCWSEEKTGQVRVWIEDNGIGIPADQHQRVFRVFERLHGSRYAGTGIGLSIVRKGIERMGGKVGLESEPGHGTRFWLELRGAADGAKRLLSRT